jgi:hypothetical protein
MTNQGWFNTIVFIWLLVRTIVVMAHLYYNTSYTIGREDLVISLPATVGLLAWVCILLFA